MILFIVCYQVVFISFKIVCVVEFIFNKCVPTPLFPSYVILFPVSIKTKSIEYSNINIQQYRSIYRYFLNNYKKNGEKSSISAYPRSSGTPTLEPFPENVLTLRETRHRRRRLDLVHKTVTPV